MFPEIPILHAHSLPDPRPAASSSATPSAGSAASRWPRCSTTSRPAPGSATTRSRPSRRTFPAKARAVIFLFMAGGPSHLETFDPKPLLNKLEGQTRPKEFGEAKYQFVQRNAKLLGTRRTFKKYGQSGIEVSDLFPHTARCVDDLAVIRSCHGDMVVHSAAQYELFTGRIVARVPEHGVVGPATASGSESQSLPAYVVMPDPKGALEAGQPMYMHGFLPAVYQPTMFRPGDRPVLNLDLPPGVDPRRRRRTLELIRDLNRGDARPGRP